MLPLWIYRLLGIAPAPSQPKPPKTWPKSPCGYDEIHDYWTNYQGWTCPKCAGIERNKKEMQDEDRLARKIASNVVRLRRLEGIARRSKS